jgi:trans-aconitate methyltransferase
VSGTPAGGEEAPGRLLDASRVADCFDVGADDYEEIVWRNRRGAERLVASLPVRAYDHVLDVGCGTGFASVALLQRLHPRSITGVDLSRGMLERFRARLSETPDVIVAAYEADVLDMPVVPGSVDLVLSSMAFHWFPDRPGAVKAMADALGPDGVLAVLTGCDGTEEEYRGLLDALDPPVPPALTEIYSGLVGLEEMARLLEDAGLDPIDVWIERRRRVGPPDRFLERMRLVAGHLIADLPAAEQDAIWNRIRTALVARCGDGPFVYHFHKLYAVARRPPGPRGP